MKTLNRLLLLAGLLMLLTGCASNRKYSEPYGRP